MLKTSSTLMRLEVSCPLMERSSFALWRHASPSLMMFLRAEPSIFVVGKVRCKMAEKWCLHNYPTGLDGIALPMDEI